MVRREQREQMERGERRKREERQMHVRCASGYAVLSAGATESLHSRPVQNGQPHVGGFGAEDPILPPGLGPSSL